MISVRSLRSMPDHPVRGIPTIPTPGERPRLLKRRNRRSTHLSRELKASAITMIALNVSTNRVSIGAGIIALSFPPSGRPTFATLPPECQRQIRDLITGRDQGFRVARRAGGAGMDSYALSEWRQRGSAPSHQPCRAYEGWLQWKSSQAGRFRRRRSWRDHGIARCVAREGR